MDEYLTKGEHNEYKESQNKENNRINKRLELLENTVRQINALTLSVEKLATNMESMLNKQTEQGKRLEELEGRDGEKWRSVSMFVLTTLIGMAAGFVIQYIGM